MAGQRVEKKVKKKNRPKKAAASTAAAAGHAFGALKSRLKHSTTAPAHSAQGGAVPGVVDAKSIVSLDDILAEKSARKSARAGPYSVSDVSSDDASAIRETGAAGGVLVLRDQDENEDGQEFVHEPEKPVHSARMEEE